MRGGIAGVRRMVADFRRRGVQVLFPMMLWDQGTNDTEESPQKPTVPIPQRNRIGTKTSPGRHSAGQERGEAATEEESG